MHAISVFVTIFIFLQLALKTVNSARSAYACFLFQRTFFHSYRDGMGGHGKEVGSRGGARDEEDKDSGLKCKILAKVIVY